HFHSDGVFNDVPSLASLLYAIEVPSVGGDTLFIDMNEVYRSLDAKTQAFIADKYAINYHNYESLGVERGKIDKNARHATHPMVTVHPVTGKPVLYVNSLHTREIVGMEQEAALRLLDELFAVTEQPRFI